MAAWLKTTFKTSEWLLVVDESMMKLLAINPACIIRADVNVENQIVCSFTLQLVLFRMFCHFAITSDEALSLRSVASLCVRV